MEIIQVPSPNYTSGRKWQRIKKIFIHWVAVGTAKSAANYFTKTSSQTSAHYCVGDNTIYQCVQEKDTAWHAGVWDENLQSIGIEHEATPTRPATDLTYETSAALIASICKRHNIPLDKEHIVGHKTVKATQCPGTVDIDRLIRLAKGDNMDNDKIAEMQKEIDGLRNSRNTWRDNYKDLKGICEERGRSYEEQIKELDGKCKKDRIIWLETKERLERRIERLEASSGHVGLCDYTWSERLKSLFICER